MVAFILIAGVISYPFFGPLITVLMVSIIGPILLGMQQSKARKFDAAQRKEERQEEYTRQDVVAERLAKEVRETRAEAEIVAAKLLLAQKETKDRTEEVARIAAISDEKQSAKLEQIHILVNSNVTVLIESVLTSQKSVLALLEQRLETNKKIGVEPSAAVLVEIDLVKEKVSELESQLVDRKIQTDLAAKEVQEVTEKAEQEKAQL